MDEPDEQGYVVIPGFVDRAVTEAVRRRIDDLSPPPSTARDAQQLTWSHRHPIEGEVLADIAVNPDLLDLARRSLATRSVADLTLLEQVLIRTDPRTGTGASDRLAH